MRLHLSSPLQSDALRDFIERIAALYRFDNIHLFRYDSSLRLLQGAIRRNSLGIAEYSAAYLYAFAPSANRSDAEEADDLATLILRRNDPDLPFLAERPFPSLAVPLRLNGLAIGCLAADYRERLRPVAEEMLVRLMEEGEKIAPTLADYDVTRPDDLLGGVWDALSDGVCLISVNGGIIRANDALIQMFGATESDMIARDGADFFAPLTKDGRSSPLRERFQSEDDWEAEFHSMRSDGSLFPLRMKMIRLYPKTGSHCRAALIQDMSQKLALKRAERRRRSAEESLRHVIRLGRCILWRSEVVDHAGYVTQPIAIIDEEAAQHILPLELKDGQTYSEAWEACRHPDDVDRCKKTALHAYRGGKASYQQEFRSLNQYGEYQWLYEDVSIRSLGPGKWSSVGVCADITEKKRIELTLAANEERFRGLIENSGDIIALADEEENIVYISPSSFAILGYMPEEMIGRSVASLAHEEDRDSVFLFFDELKLRREERRKLIHRIRRKDGEWRWLEWVGVNHLENPNIRAFVINCRDITEKIEADERIQFQASLLDQVRNAVIAVNLDGEIIYWNAYAEALYQWTKEEMAGRENATIASLPRGQRDAIEEHLASEGYWEGELRVRRKDGSEFPAHVEMTVLKDPREKRIGAIAVSADITERKRMEEALFKHEEDMRRFQERLKGLHDINLLLSREKTVDSLCFKAVEFGRAHLGIDRFSIWLMTEDPDVLTGVYGTDETGRTRYERDQKVRSLEENRNLRFEKHGVIVRKDWPLRDDQGREIGRGWHASSAIRDGDKVIGLMNSDNLFSGNPIEDSEIELLGLYGSIIGNLLARLKSVEALSESEARYRRLVETANVIPWEMDLDENRMEYIGPQAEEILGYSLDQLYQQRFVKSRVHPDDLPRFEDEFRNIKKDDKEDRSLEFRIFRGDGSILWIHDRFSMKKHADGHRHLHGFFMDITERKESEISLRQSSELLQTIFDNIPLMIHLFDSDDRLLFVNRFWERTFDQSRRGLSKSALMDEFFSESDRSQEAFEFMNNPDGQWRDFRMKIRDDRYIESSWISLNLSDGSNLGIGQDITEWKRMEEQLQQARKMEAVGRLAGGVAHDFNNMLSVINGYSEILLHRIPSDDPSRRQIEQIKKAGERASDLTRQLLAFSRKQILKPKIIDLNVIVNGMESMIRRLIGEDIELFASLQADLKSIKADPTQIEQVIINLAVNARDAMPDGGALRIETANETISEETAQRNPVYQPGDYVRLTVADTGIGMTKEAMERIFEPFYTTKEMGKGTGLGLATIYGIVKQSDGFIYPESEPGEGAKFNVYLPAIEEKAKEADPSASPMQSGSETILLVEDEDLVRQVVRDSLEASGYRILDAKDGEEALMHCDQRGDAIDLMITDVVMPKMNGRELAEKARILRPEMRILFMSGYTEDTILRQGVEIGAAGFIQKPFSAADLILKIKSVLKNRR